MVSGVLDAALEIAERRTAIQRAMKQALLENNLAKVLECACGLTGLAGEDLEITRDIPQKPPGPIKLMRSRFSTI